MKPLSRIVKELEALEKKQLYIHYSLIFIIFLLIGLTIGFLFKIKQINNFFRQQKVQESQLIEKLNSKLEQYNAKIKVNND